MCQNDGIKNYRYNQREDKKGKVMISVMNKKAHHLFSFSSSVRRQGSSTRITCL